jgi:hypothetical protein
LGGNHDNYEEWEGRFIQQPAHFLGDFGVHKVPSFGEFFFLRGGYSIDKAYRKEGRDWWPGEEVSYSQGMKALEMYGDLKLLGRMWEIHKPRLWVFGHHHHDWFMSLEGTAFRCLPIMGVLDFDKIGDE